MPKKIPPREIQNWLERHDAGDGIETIAKAAKKDPRVVRKHVETAMRQRDIRTAHRRLIEDALRQHQEDLMLVVQELREVVQAAPPEVDVGDPGAVNKGLKLRSSVAYRDAAGYSQLELEIEAHRTWDLLRQHLSSDPLWDAIAKWRGAMLRDLNERLRLWDAVWEKAEHETDYRVQDPPEDIPYLTRFYPRLIYHEVAHRLLGMDSTLVQEWAFEAEADGSVRFEMGAHKVVVAKAPGDEKHCTDTLLRLIDERIEWSEAEEFRQAYEEAARVAQKARAILEDIQLLHFIPGQCATCRRLGL